MTSLPQRPGSGRYEDIPNLEEELRLALAARKELGAQHENQLVDSFIEKLDRTIVARAAQERDAGKLAKQRAAASAGRLAIALGVGIPLSAISLGMAGLPGLIVVWLSIVVLSIYFDQQSR